MSVRQELDNLRQLMREIVLPFHEIERDLPIKLGNSTRNENDSEHSWTLALITAVLAPKLDPTIDVGKAVRLAVVHDVVEVYAGDTSIWADSKQLASKTDREAQAFKAIQAAFGKQFPELVKLIEEYEARQTDEALFVWALDKFVSFLTVEPNGAEAFRSRDVTYQDFLRVYEQHRPKGTAHPAVAPLYNELLQTVLNNRQWFAAKNTRQQPRAKNP